MDTRKLRVGNPPIDRQCRLCMKIGHFAKNCPQRVDLGIRFADDVDEMVDNMFGKNQDSSSRNRSMSGIHLIFIHFFLFLKFNFLEQLF